MEKSNTELLIDEPKTDEITVSLRAQPGRLQRAQTYSLPPLSFASMLNNGIFTELAQFPPFPEEIDLSPNSQTSGFISTLRERSQSLLRSFRSLSHSLTPSQISDDIRINFYLLLN